MLKSVSCSNTLLYSSTNLHIIKTNGCHSELFVVYCIYCDYRSSTYCFYIVICQSLLAIYGLTFMDYSKERKENLKRLRKRHCSCVQKQIKNKTVNKIND